MAGARDRGSAGMRNQVRTPISVTYLEQMEQSTYLTFGHMQYIIQYMAQKPDIWIWVLLQFKVVNKVMGARKL